VTVAFRKATLFGSLTCAAVFAVAACSSTAEPLAFRTIANVATGASKSGHLYVADPGSNAIYRYDLVDGLPQTFPDEIFATLSNPSSLGVDASGHIYAEASTEVYEFSKNGTVLGYFDIPAAGAFAVDVQGYTYIAASKSQIAVYSPKAYQVHGMGKPIATLTASGYNYDDIAYLAADAQQRLYASAWRGIDIWNRPHQTSSKQSLIILHPLPRINSAAWFNEALAFDENQRLYAAVGYQTYCGSRCKKQYWEDTDFDAVTGWLKPGRKDRMIYAGECWLGYTTDYSSGYELGGTVTGLAAYGGFLEAACRGDTTEVWVYRADRFGRQHAVETLDGLTAPSDVKIGP
jgi:hypothetical protein